jgi:adenylate cyclase
MASDENRTRTIVLPGWPDAISQIAVPMIAHDTLQGILFAESRDRLAFDSADEAVLTLVANQTASALALEEALAPEQSPTEDTVAAPASDRKIIQITHHAYDDSVFVDGEYVIKGVPGRLLMFLLDAYLREGRVEFTNRGIRLAKSLRLPDFKDNLETRLLLLRRRLDDKSLPLGLEHIGRGRIRLRVLGSPSIQRVD